MKGMEHGGLRTFLAAGWVLASCALGPCMAVAAPAPVGGQGVDTTVSSLPAAAASAATPAKHHRRHRRRHAASDVSHPSGDAAVAAGATLPPVQQQTYYTSPGGTYPSVQDAGAALAPSPYPPSAAPVNTAATPTPPLPPARAAAPAVVGAVPVSPAAGVPSPPLAPLTRATATPSPPLPPVPPTPRAAVAPTLPPAVDTSAGTASGYVPNAQAVPARVPTPVLPPLDTQAAGAAAAAPSKPQIPMDVAPPEPSAGQGWQSHAAAGGGAWASTERAPTPYASPNTVAPSRAPNFESNEPITTVRSAQGTGGLAPPSTSLAGAGQVSQSANSGTAVTPLGPSYAVAPPPSDQQSNAPGGFVIGVGDTLNVTVYGRTELSGIVTVSSDGSVSLALIGEVMVAGLTPADASAKIAKAYRQGQFLLNPQVSVVPTEFRSKQISVLGEVKNPGRFPVNTSLNVLDALALAGGIEESGSRQVYVLRPHNNTVDRFEVDLDALVHANQGNGSANSYFPILAGDTVVVPKADQFYIYGEVRQPNAYRIVRNLTVMQAISMAGGLTDKGSDSRVEIRRRKNGTVQKRSAELEEAVKPDDVIYVHERLF